jgi:hypothetical protein
MCLSEIGTATADGVVVGPGAIGVGTGVADTISQLAAKFYPGPKPSAIGGVGLSLCLLLVSGALIDGDALGAGLGVAFLGVLIGAGALLNKSGQESIRQRKMAMCEHGWICMQCGASWIPKAGAAEAREAFPDRSGNAAKY